ncbi:hypothetical protein BpHYR1_031073 [Brachionus plicatilis]|uniref:Uncharacterized protein n=1 Tax=Brachionus plicatilis TaxID=10195 RepID=A0A3M7RXU9_BRAPC|nr:hypothetical protein BpHYR1_031073 [Brachionus plicatilis]
MKLFFIHEKIPQRKILIENLNFNTNSLLKKIYWFLIINQLKSKYLSLPTLRKNYLSFIWKFKSSILINNQPFVLTLSNDQLIMCD